VTTRTRIIRGKGKQGAGEGDGRIALEQRKRNVAESGVEKPSHRASENKRRKNSGGLDTKERTHSDPPIKAASEN